MLLVKERSPHNHMVPHFISVYTLCLLIYPKDFSKKFILRVHPKIFFPKLYPKSFSTDFVTIVCIPDFFPGSSTLVTSHGELGKTFGLCSLVIPLLTFQSKLSSFFLFFFFLFPLTVLIGIISVQKVSHQIKLQK